MPELPEVEHAATRLRRFGIGRTIASVQPLHPRYARELGASARKSLVGREITAVTRRAKVQLITLSDGQILEVHFRMTGDWHFSHTGEPPPPYERLRIDCVDSSRISLTDSRALGVLRVHAAGRLQLPPLGPEPLSAEFSVHHLAAALATRHTAIKPLLLNQKIVAGMGNIYAAEALWLSRIHPARVASRISLPRVTQLRDAIRKVLSTADGTRYYGTREADMTNAVAELPRAGTYNEAGQSVASADADGWQVYGREHAACGRCAHRILRITQAGRSTFYCGGCQR